MCEDKVADRRHKYMSWSGLIESDKKNSSDIQKKSFEYTFSSKSIFSRELPEGSWAFAFENDHKIFTVHLNQTFLWGTEEKHSFDTVVFIAGGIILLFSYIPQMDFLI